MDTGLVWDTPLAWAVWVSQGAHGLAGGGFRGPDLAPPAGWARLREGGQVVLSLSPSGCISLSGSTGKKISVQSYEFLPQAGWEGVN